MPRKVDVGTSERIENWVGELFVIHRSLTVRSGIGSWRVVLFRSNVAIGSVPAATYLDVARTLDRVQQPIVQVGGHRSNVLKNGSEGDAAWMIGAGLVWLVVE